LYNRKFARMKYLNYIKSEWIRMWSLSLDFYNDLVLFWIVKKRQKHIIAAIYRWSLQDNVRVQAKDDAAAAICNALLLQSHNERTVY